MRRFQCLNCQMSVPVEYGVQHHARCFKPIDEPLYPIKWTLRVGKYLTGFVRTWIPKGDNGVEGD